VYEIKKECILLTTFAVLAYPKYNSTLATRLLALLKLLQGIFGVDTEQLNATERVAVT
jgi:hypothetical protein